MKLYTIIGPLGDCDIPAANPQAAAALYPTRKGHKSSIAQEYVVKCDQTGERFRVIPQAAYIAEKL
jgi:hypothetical protein